MRDVRELWLPPVQRWGPVPSLVEMLGCQLHVETSEERMARYEGTITPYAFALGDASIRAMLLRDGSIFTPVKLRHWGPVLHEALHWRLGPWSFRSERAMVAFELDLIRRIEPDKARRRLLASFSDVFIDGTVTIGDMVKKYGPSWPRSPRWQQAQAAARARGFRPGRLPPRHSWTQRQLEST